MKNTKKNKQIRVIGAREHNLKNVSVEIPKDKLTVITGPSGSGKSSLALDILFTEGKRRYMESLSSYARQFLGIARKPEVDSIDGLCPSVAIEQKTVGANPRSTVGTITEIYDYLRVLFARVGKPSCPDCGHGISQESPEKIAQLLHTNFKGQMVTVASPIAQEKKGEFFHHLHQLFLAGHYRFKIDGKNYKFRSEEEIKELKLKKTYKHTIDVIIDAISVCEEEKVRVTEAIEKAFSLTNGTCKIITEKESQIYSSHRMCVKCMQSFPELEPRMFSFNSPVGACKKCSGLGIIHEWPWKEGDKDHWKSQYPDFFSNKYATQFTCDHCDGKRLNKHALAVLIGDKTIFDIGNMSIVNARDYFNELKLDETSQEIAESLIQEVRRRLTFLFDVGLTYLTLNRTARTLSGGEGQRIRLATQIGSALSGVLYILDEPSIGLHQRDNDRLIETLKALRDQGNTVLVVEHDVDTIRQADHVIDMGPEAGILGGEVTAFGSPAQLEKNKNSLTGAYLSGKKSIVIPKERRKPTAIMTLKNATRNNLKNVSVDIPLGVMCGVSGVSGSGKSSLIFEELVPTLQGEFTRPYSGRDKYDGRSEKAHLEGAQSVVNMVVIDQSPIGRTSRSNPATYLGVFDEIRALFASLPESNLRGYKVGRFSFNVQDGRCFECSGDGTIKVSMQFLPDVVTQCKACKGQRYNAKTLEIKFKNRNVAQVLEMTAYEALEFFSAHRTIHKKLQLLCDVGLDYLALGQSSTTLSGGEAQRIKLVKELAKRGSGTLYVLDEPTTGLHNHDIDKLLKVLNTLVDKDNSMIIIEHNLDVLKTVDYVIDLGPEGGEYGGEIVVAGTPEEVAKSGKGYTGKYLKEYLG
ncbi:MAG TPA: excinuclease ABC subunit UvrA [Candidatus Babeliales bacterium]|nr:excinuclease ABC subunit UvrA [Candidatus Babeliales bacterium]